MWWWRIRQTVSSATVMSVLGSTAVQVAGTGGAGGEPQPTLSSLPYLVSTMQCWTIFTTTLITLLTSEFIAKPVCRMHIRLPFSYFYDLFN